MKLTLISLLRQTLISLHALYSSKHQDSAPSATNGARRKSSQHQAASVVSSDCEASRMFLLLPHRRTIPHSNFSASSLSSTINRASPFPLSPPSAIKRWVPLGIRRCFDVDIRLKQHREVDNEISTLFHRCS